MRIVVLGATGNVGTAVLHRLQAADEVSSIVGVSRRGPDRAGAPYDGVEWHRLDVAEPAAAGGCARSSPAPTPSSTWCG